MRIIGTALTLMVAITCASDPAEAGHACGHRLGRRPARISRLVAFRRPACMTVYATPMPPYAAQRTTMAISTAQIAAPPAAMPAATNATPIQAYQPPPGPTPAYYYTYDKDDRLIPVRWMDWLFRGGIEAGEPPPPLPIIGRLQGR